MTVVDNSPSNYAMMLREMASARALVCPLLPDKLNYCVGLSTITDAEGLSKPLILTDNPYHGTRPEEDGYIRVTSVKDWESAINLINSKGTKQITSSYSMTKAYDHIKNVLFLNF